MNRAARIALALLWLSGLAHAEEWPRWRGPRGDGISREALPETLPAAGWKTAWRAAVGLGYASPVAYGGKVLLFYQEAGRAREVLSAYDAQSGRVLWRDGSEGGFVVGPTGGFPGTRATPAIDDAGQTVTTFGGSGELVRRDLATGAQRWRINVIEQTGAENRSDGTCSSPLLAGALVYVQGGFDGPLAVAVYASTGRIAWKSALRGNSGVAPAVLMQSQGRVMLVVLAKDTVVAMDPSSGATWWTHHLPGAGATPIVVGERLVVTTDGGRGMVALEPGVGGVREVWSNPRMTSTFVSPIRDGEALYGNSRGTLKSLVLVDGKLNWAAPKSDFQLGFGGSLVRSGDKLLLLGDHGLLSLARATPQGVHKLGQMQVLGGEDNWATPLLYRNRIYVRGASQLLCLDPRIPAR